MHDSLTVGGRPRRQMHDFVSVSDSNVSTSTLKAIHDSVSVRDSVSVSISAPSAVVRARAGIHAAGAPTVSITPTGPPYADEPERERGLAREAWLLTAVGATTSIGAAIDGKTGALMGVAVGFTWAAWRWSR